MLFNPCYGSLVSVFDELVFNFSFILLIIGFVEFLFSLGILTLVINGCFLAMMIIHTIIVNRNTAIIILIISVNIQMASFLGTQFISISRLYAIKTEAANPDGILFEMGLIDRKL